MVKQKRSKLAEVVAAGRELVALLDGPWRCCWYWADELAAVQRTAMRHAPDHPAATLAHYRPTGERVVHPTEADVTGTGWRYRPGSLTPAVPEPRRPAERLAQMSKVSQVSQVSKVPDHQGKAPSSVAGVAGSPGLFEVRS